MKHCLLTLLGLCLTAFAVGQTEDDEWNRFLNQSNSGFEQFKQKNDQDFEAFRKQALGLFRC